MHKQESLETSLSLAVLSLLHSLKIHVAVLKANMRQAGKRVPQVTVPQEGGVGKWGWGGDGGKEAVTGKGTKQYSVTVSD